MKLNHEGIEWLESEEAPTSAVSDPNRSRWISNFIRPMFELIDDHEEMCGWPHCPDTAWGPLPPVSTPALDHGRVEAFLNGRHLEGLENVSVTFTGHFTGREVYSPSHGRHLMEDTGRAQIAPNLLPATLSPGEEFNG